MFDLGFLLIVVVVALVIAGATSGRRTVFGRVDRPQDLGGLYGPDQGFGGPLGPGSYGAQPQLGAHPGTWEQPQQGPWGMNAGGWGGAMMDPPLSAEARGAVDSDITKFGDELRDLDLDVVGFDLTEEAQAEYSTALDAYENAKQALQQATLSSDVTAITHILEEGRFAMASVKARAHGKPVPERRPPCFFDPAHGPSVGNVSWSPDGGVARDVPACALDTARVRSGSNPHIRMVGQGAGMGMVPYWQDAQFAPYARGYYQSYGFDPVVRGMATGALMFGGLSLLMGFLDD